LFTSIKALDRRWRGDDEHQGSPIQSRNNWLAAEGAGGDGEEGLRERIEESVARGGARRCSTAAPDGFAIAPNSP
jgi:hypothetical protein